jgi:hypothetical protein
MNIPREVNIYQGPQRQHLVGECILCGCMLTNLRSRNDSNDVLGGRRPRIGKDLRVLGSRVLSDGLCVQLIEMGQRAMLDGDQGRQSTISVKVGE